MQKLTIKHTELTCSPVIAGCMRFGEMSTQEMNRFIHSSLECGVNFFDHADIYANGKSEQIFGKAMSLDSSVRREDIILQPKCGIRQGYYDQSKEYIINFV